MLESIHLKNVGPAPEMTMNLAPRLNLVTGDNGLGKSFLLDVAWWALTRTWARHPVVPTTRGASISYSYTKKTPRPYAYTSKYDPASERWSVSQGRPAIPGLILYAQVDGGFSVWDPARNYWTEDAPDRPNAYLFSASEVWAGNQYCEGLLRDWGSWQREKSRPFELLSKVLGALSPSSDEKEKLQAGDLRKLTVSDPLRYPTLRMPYGEDVAVIHASAGMRRIIALAYLLIWTWEEHLASAKVRGEPPAREVVFLIDEIEAHLHPQWQRRIVPALLQVMDILTGQHGSRVQLVAATHSPLVLASVEPLFDADKDAWFDLDLDRTSKPYSVKLTPRTYVRHGEIGNWLTSEAFDLKEPRSLEGERAVKTALALMDREAASDAAVVAADKALRDAGLPDIDPFWVRWGYFRDRRAKQAPAKPRRKRA
ncbi:AAA family ATPase [Sorangium sp. So ce426]|uniref:AAA family ATPase n=1 Tax=unclassified Sorangium TaxID=2621164 RepID=UPI003F5B7ACD